MPVMVSHHCPISFNVILKQQQQDGQRTTNLAGHARDESLLVVDLVDVLSSWCC
jgi:hypothetical protein